MLFFMKKSEKHNARTRTSVLSFSILFDLFANFYYTYILTRKIL